MPKKISCQQCRDKHGMLVIIGPGKPGFKDCADCIKGYHTATPKDFICPNVSWHDCPKCGHLIDRTLQHWIEGIEKEEAKKC